MYLCVYLFRNKPPGPHEVDFIIGNMRDYKISCPKRGEVWGGGGIREEGLN